MVYWCVCTDPVIVRKKNYSGQNGLRLCSSENNLNQVWTTIDPHCDPDHFLGIFRQNQRSFAVWCDP